MNSTELIKMIIASSQAPAVDYGEYGIRIENGQVVCYCYTNNGTWGSSYRYLGYGTGNYNGELENWSGVDYWVKRFTNSSNVKDGDSKTQTVQMSNGFNGTKSVIVGQIYYF